MKLIFSKPNPVTFEEISEYHTFVFENEVYVKIAVVEAVCISKNTKKSFYQNELVSPCVVEEITVRKV